MDKVLLKEGMTVDEMVSALNDKDLDKDHKNDEENYRYDCYDIVFNILLDFFNIATSQWRKIKWVARRLESRYRGHEG